MVVGVVLMVINKTNMVFYIIGFVTVGSIIIVSDNLIVNMLSIIAIISYSIADMALMQYIARGYSNG